MWYVVTITDATGNISRGTFILRTSDLFLTTDLVPAFSVSVKNVHHDHAGEDVQREQRDRAAQVRAGRRCTKKYIENRTSGFMYDQASPSSEAW